MNRQGSHSFTIDALMSPSVSSRIGPSVYNNGYMYLPTAGNLNLLRGISGYTGSDGVLSSAMMQYAQTPFPPFPLITGTNGLYPGPLHSAFTSSAFAGLPGRTCSSGLQKLDPSEKLLKKSQYDVPNTDEDTETPRPTDLRISTSKPDADSDGVPESRVEDVDDHHSDLSIEGKVFFSLLFLLFE